MKKEIFETKEQYLEMKAAWKSRCTTIDQDGKIKKEYIPPFHFALYAILCDKDWRKGFSGNSEASTIEWIERSIFRTKPQYLQLKSAFGETVTEEHIEKMREIGGIPRWEGESK